jgi:hypothetical protein
MPIGKHWERLGPSDWDAFAQTWLAELRASSVNEESDVRQSVVMMNFTATAEQQWRFILAALAHAESDDELGHIAAGPVEHLLGKHGERCIDEVERLAAVDPKFARIMSGVWQHMMADEVWARVQALKARLPDTSSTTESKSAE